jgi:hypothetical protein
MPPTIREIGPDLYHRYAEIDPSYEVTSVLKVVPRDGGLGGQPVNEERRRAMWRPYKTSIPCEQNCNLLTMSGLCEIGRGMLSGSKTRKRLYLETT